MSTSHREPARQSKPRPEGKRIQATALARKRPHTHLERTSAPQSKKK